MRFCLAMATMQDTKMLRVRLTRFMRTWICWNGSGPRKVSMGMKALTKAKKAEDDYNAVT